MFSKVFVIIWNTYLAKLFVFFNNAYLLELIHKKKYFIKANFLRTLHINITFLMNYVTIQLFNLTIFNNSSLNSIIVLKININFLVTEVKYNLLYS